MITSTRRLATAALSIAFLVGCSTAPPTPEAKDEL